MTRLAYATLGDRVFVVVDTAERKVVRAQKSVKSSKVPTSAALAANDTELQRLQPRERQ